MCYKRRHANASCAGLDLTDWWFGVSFRKNWFGSTLFSKHRVKRTKSYSWFQTKDRHDFKLCTEHLESKEKSPCAFFMLGSLRTDDRLSCWCWRDKICVTSEKLYKLSWGSRQNYNTNIGWVLIAKKIWEISVNIRSNDQQKDDLRVTSFTSCDNSRLYSLLWSVDSSQPRQSLWWEKNKKDELRSLASQSQFAECCWHVWMFNQLNSLAVSSSAASQKNPAECESRWNRRLDSDASCWDFSWRSTFPAASKRSMNSPLRKRAADPHPKLQSVEMETDDPRNLGGDRLGRAPSVFAGATRPSHMMPLVTYWKES